MNSIQLQSTAIALSHSPVSRSQRRSGRSPMLSDAAADAAAAAAETVVHCRESWLTIDVAVRVRESDSLRLVLRACARTNTLILPAAITLRHYNRSPSILIQDIAPSPILQLVISHCYSKLRLQYRTTTTLAVPSSHHHACRLTNSTCQCHDRRPCLCRYGATENAGQPSMEREMFT